MKKTQKYYDIYNASPLQGKIFYLLIILGLMMSVATTLINIVLDLGLATILTTILFGLFCLLILIITIKSTNYIRSAYVTFWVLILVVYPALWFFNGGTFGPTLIIYILSTFLTSIIFDKAKTQKLLLVQLITLVFLLTIEFTNPSYIKPYSSDQVRFLDLSLSAIIIILISYVIVNRLMDEYRLSIEELNVVQKKLQRLTITDELTGIYNRRYIMQSISNQLTDDHILPFTLIMFDIDDFKHINDCYGHSVGDDVIIRVSNFLFESVRAIDVVGRIGGEEFLMLLMDTNEEKARERADTIRQQLSELTWPIDDLKVTVSGGLYTKKPKDNLEALLERADFSLYQAKSSGKNRIM